MSAHKRPRLSSPQPSSSSSSSKKQMHLRISSSPVSDDGSDEPVIIKIEDVSDSDGDDDNKNRSVPPPLVADYMCSNVPSPMKMLSLVHAQNFMSNLQMGTATGRFLDIHNSIMSSNVSSTSSIQSPFARRSSQTIGSPKYMVQEISSTVNDKRFLLTSLDINVKERLKVMIKKLGATYIDTPTFVESCTHVILGKPNLGEKFLGGLICGKWLLKPEYIEESYNQNYWVEEDSYEWSSAGHVPNTNKEIARLAAATKRCRIKHCAHGPFQNWTSIVLSHHPRRQECYERLFKAGGGRVINVTDFKNRYKELKMILVDNPEQTHIPTHLKTSKIPLVRINFLHSLVLEEVPPEIKTFVIKTESKKPQHYLPKVPWIPTYIGVNKTLNLITDASPINVTEFVKGILEYGHTRSILLPLALRYRPDLKLVRQVIQMCRNGKENESCIKQFMAKLIILSWHMPPIAKNRSYYLNLLSETSPGESFLELLRDCVYGPVSSHKLTFSQQYFTWWAKLLERDFINWISVCQARPLAEDLFCGWHKTSKTMRAFLKSYQEIMSNRNLPENLKESVGSILVVQHTSNEIKRKVFIAQRKDIKSGTLDLITNSVCITATRIIHQRDRCEILKFLSRISHSPNLSLQVLDKVLINMNKSWVPCHYECLANRPPSWEKFFNFYAHVRYTTKMRDCDEISDQDREKELDTEIYLIVLSTMFRTLYYHSSTPPSVHHGPIEKTRELKCNLTLYLNTRSTMILNIMIKSIEILSKRTAV